MATNKESIKEHLLKYGGEVFGEDRFGRLIIVKGKYTVYLLGDDSVDLFMTAKKLKRGECVATCHKFVSWPKKYSAIALCENLDQTKGTLRITEVVEL